MTVLQSNVATRQKISFPRRIATYITSMNLSKVFRRHNPKPSSDKSPCIQKLHGYPRPFSYHIPMAEPLSPSSSSKMSGTVPYRIGLTGDNALLTNGQTNENDDIVRLPIKTPRKSSPRLRKDRRQQAQIHANKKWLFRSMETLDGWKEKVFPHKNRPASPCQSRSRSVENLTDKETREAALLNSNSSIIQEQRRATSPHRSIEAITNRAISSIGIHKKSTNFIPNTLRSPALTVKKQSQLTQTSNGHNKLSQPYSGHREINSSTVLDFRELSAIDFLHSKPKLFDDNEEISLISSENIINDVALSGEENEDGINSSSYLSKSCDHSNEINIEPCDSWDFGLTWIDSLKEQNSPQKKIQFYENLIKLLEQDTLSIDELLVLRKILAKIWPTTGNSTADSNDHIFSMESKTTTTQSLHDPNKIKRRPRLPMITNHTAQRCSAIIEQLPLTYEQLHEQHSGHVTNPSSLLVTAKAKPYFIENITEPKYIQTDVLNTEQTYPQHLNPFDNETDGTITKESDHNTSNESIRRYFERLTLLETIYEKLNIESNKKPEEYVHRHPPPSVVENTQQSTTQQSKESKLETRAPLPIDPLTKTGVNKNIKNKLIEMNVDGTGSVSSGKSSVKRRAPTAPHLSNNHRNHQQQYSREKTPITSTKPSSDACLIRQANSDKTLSPSPNHCDSNLTKVILIDQPPLSTQDPTGACDDDGLIFVYDQEDTRISSTNVLPKKSERIQQWLSSCEPKPESDTHIDLLHIAQNTNPQTQVKMRCLTKSLRPIGSSSQNSPERSSLSKSNNEFEPGRYRSCLKIHLETNEPANYRKQVQSTTSKSAQRQSSLDDKLHEIESERLQSNTLSPSFQYDHQAVFL